MFCCCIKHLRRLRRGIRRQTVKNLLALCLFVGSAFVLTMTYLEDCRFFALSSDCEPEYITVKLNDTFISIANAETTTAGRNLTVRNRVRGAMEIEKLLENAWEHSPDKRCTTGDCKREHLPIPTEMNRIEAESLELKMDPVFEDRRDYTGQACSEMLDDAIKREFEMKKGNSNNPVKNPHVSFSVGATGAPDMSGKSKTLDNVSNSTSKVKRRRGRMTFHNFRDINITGVAMPRYFQAQMKTHQNRWVHYHRIIQSSKGPTHNKVVEIKWCPIFKAASTPWLAVFTKLSKALTQHSEAAIKKGKMGFLELARTYRLLTPRRYDKNVHPVRTTMIVVRHPFKRLLSGYKDKIERVKGRLYYYNKYSTKILRKYRKHNPGQLEKMAKDKDFSLKIPTFQEFVMFVLSFQPRKLDEHWRPMFLDCNPCHKKFDFVLKVETLNEDMKKVLKYLHLKETDSQYKDVMDVWHRWNNPSTSSKNGSNHKNESFYFSQLTKQDMKRLYDVYEPDFRLFGYSPEPYFSMANRTVDNERS